MMHLKGFFASWTTFMWFFKLPLFCKTTTTKVALHFPYLNELSVQVPFTFKVSITSITFERFLSLMNRRNVSFLMRISCKARIKKWCIWKVSFLHELLLCDFSNCLFFVKLLAHKSQSTFLPSWTDAMCLFKSPLLTKSASQVLHLKGFFP